MTDLTKNQAWQMVKRLIVVSALKGVLRYGDMPNNDTPNAENEKEFNELFSNLHDYFHSQETKQ